MKGHGSKFDRKKEAAIAALLAERSQARAARVVGIDLSTLKRWMQLRSHRGVPASSLGNRGAGIRARQQNTPVAASVLLKLMADPKLPRRVASAPRWASSVSRGRRRISELGTPRGGIGTRRGRW